MCVFATSSNGSPLTFKKSPNRYFSTVEVSPTKVVSFASFAYTVYDKSGDSPGHFCETPGTIHLNLMSADIMLIQYTI